MAARTLGEERVASVQLHARLVVRAMAAVAGDTHVPSRNALYRPIVVEQDLRGWKSRKNLNPKFLGLARQPATEIAEAKRVCAAIAHERRHQHLGNTELALPPQHP